MKMKSLTELYAEELQDAYDFEHQLLEALPKMEEAAHSADLKRALASHRRETQGQVERLERVFESLGHEAERKSCKGMKGLISEGEDYVKAKGDEAVIDAALISAAQRVEHYEMAAYGTLRAYARTLGHEDQARLLDESLEEEAAADEKLSRLAEDSINAQALRAV
jgi:ferritin-like metal-binding protein YciE